MKKSHRIEYIVKGFANKNRIDILEILNKKPELSVGEISENLNKAEKNTSQHLLKMMSTGLIMKRNDGKNVRHKLTDKGIIVINFLKKI